jgi:hypothetical protein
MAMLISCLVVLALTGCASDQKWAAYENIQSPPNDDSIYFSGRTAVSDIPSPADDLYEGPASYAGEYEEPDNLVPPKR